MYPTAKQLVLLVHDTSKRTSYVEGLGLDTTAQLVPFQRSISVNVPELLVVYPTAKQLVSLVHDTALRMLLDPLLGLGTIDHPAVLTASSSVLSQALLLVAL